MAEATQASTVLSGDSHTDRVIIIVSVLLGIWLIGKSSYELAA